MLKLHIPFIGNLATKKVTLGEVVDHYYDNGDILPVDPKELHEALDQLLYFAPMDISASPWYEAVDDMVDELEEEHGFSRSGYIKNHRRDDLIKTKFKIHINRAV